MTFYDAVHVTILRHLNKNVYKNNSYKKIFKQGLISDLIPEEYEK